MHIIENYALVSGCKIDRPFIKTQKIDLPKKPYLLLHSYNPKGQDRNYKYWQEVIQMLMNHPNFNYKIFQIGQQEQHLISGVDHDYVNKLNYHQLAYLVQNCELMLCFDSFPMHLASAFDKKIIAVFGRYEQNTRPYFNCKNNYKVFTPCFDRYKPSFNNSDEYDLINQIQPKEIFEATIELLGIV